MLFKYSIINILSYNNNKILINIVWWTFERWRPYISRYFRWRSRTKKNIRRICWNYVRYLQRLNIQTQWSKSSTYQQSNRWLRNPQCSCYRFPIRLWIHHLRMALYCFPFEIYIPCFYGYVEYSIQFPLNNGNFQWNLLNWLFLNPPCNCNFHRTGYCSR